jgi:hypothetical protein
MGSAEDLTRGRKVVSDQKVWRFAKKELLVVKE